MLRQLSLRQRIRKALVILAFLSFPVTMNFLLALRHHRRGNERHCQRQPGHVWADVRFLAVPRAGLVRLGLPRQWNAGDGRAAQQPPGQRQKSRLDQVADLDPLD